MSSSVGCAPARFRGRDTSINEKMEELLRESLLVDLRQRIRDVRQGPEQLLYLLTDADDGAVLRIEPAQ